jgi:hypothetical protein
LEEQSEAKGISPTFSKSMVKRKGVFQKCVKTKQKEVKLFKILHDRSKTNVFFSNCVEEGKQKNEALFFFGKKAKKNKYKSSSTIEDLPLLVERACKGRESDCRGCKSALISANKLIPINPRLQNNFLRSRFDPVKLRAIVHFASISRSFEPT